MMQTYSNTTNLFSQPLSVEVIRFTPHEKNTRRGFASLRINPPGIVIHDLILHEKNDSRWFAFPPKPPKNDGDKWFPYVEIPDRGVLKTFQTAALEAIDRFNAQGGGQ